MAALKCKDGRPRTEKEEVYINLFVSVSDVPTGLIHAVKQQTLLVLFSETNEGWKISRQRGMNIDFEKAVGTTFGRLSSVRLVFDREYHFQQLKGVKTVLSHEKGVKGDLKNTCVDDLLQSVQENYYKSPYKVAR